MYEFSERLRSLRKDLKLSQKLVAMDLGVSQALLSHYERGIRECGLEFLVKIANYYGVSTDYILGRSNSKFGTLFLDEDEDFIDVMNAMQIVIDRVVDLRDENVVGSVKELFQIEVSKLINMISGFSNDRERLFCQDSAVTSAILSSAEALAKAKLLMALRECEESPDFDENMLVDKYPNTFEALANVARRGERMSLRLVENTELI
ncbi:MAG: helix-turn-helix transcriptional regulator [Clostridia bacterium]|nr:helix-turn-helix transcriptional regulator [Clostridia bacterium]